MMVLGSQLPRLETHRLYMTRRRRGNRWPWLVLGSIVVVLAVVFLWRNNEGEPGANARMADDGAAAAIVGDGDRDGLTGPNRATASTPSASTPATGSLPSPRPIEYRSNTSNVPSGSADTAASTPNARPTTTTPSQSSPTLTPPPRRTGPATGATVSASAATGATASGELTRGMRLIENNQLVEGRAVLSRLLTGYPPLSATDEQRVRDVLTSVNQTLVFSPQITEGDPIVERYVVQSGDLLARIAPRYKITYQIIEQINGIQARNLQAGKPIKLIKGPFFAVVTKSQFRMDIYVNSPEGLPVYIRSFPVGLGEDDSTPEGKWRVTRGRKVRNPDWRNPRTGEYFAANDPKNPIGKYWLALEGMDEQTQGLSGYGIHGTIEPDSIGRMASMGCIRLRDRDIELVFHLLLDGESLVYVQP